MVSTTDLTNLASAFRVNQGELISLVGGGGKTTTLFTLGEQLAGTTVLTTTTKMGRESMNKEMATQEINNNTTKPRDSKNETNNTTTMPRDSKKEITSNPIN